MNIRPSRPSRPSRSSRSLAATAALVLTAGLTVLASPAEAVKPVGGCPGVQWSATTLPAGGGDTSSLLWVLTLAGLEQEFGTLEAALEAFGVPDLDALAALVREGALTKFDKNGDGVVCIKDQPDTPGFPAYFFNGVDNTSHSR
ncbi:hypothetical protein ACFP3Q_10000 [Nocardioides sp. GCM10027113]|uniref:hypothetical protein n=1 Tax=unclassified Nocardioides TaxID=2615069 RepID=UPI003609B11C